MRRRDFLCAAAAAALPMRFAAGQTASLWTPPDTPKLPSPPQSIAGMTLRQLRDDYHDRLFRQYLPFWDKGGYDRQRGGFVCELNDDGSVAADEKFIWYQGRALWVYSFLYNNFGHDPRWLEIARKSRDFMLRHMYAGEGKWYEKVRSDGSLLEGIGSTVYGWLFAAMGLVEYSLAAGRQEDIDLAKQSIRAAAAAYDDPGYTDTHTTQYTAIDLPSKGLRSQGHSMVLVSTLSALLAKHQDRELAALLDRHVDIIVNKFWNPQYGIENEYLLHDYSRVPGAEGHMFTGHSLETLWIVMEEGLRRKDQTLVDTAKNRIRRLLEMCWDYVFEGWGDGDFFVLDTPRRARGPDFSVKTMWAHCEVLVACMMILEHTGELWAKEWYERCRAFTLRTMPRPEHGVWRQAVDRFGNDLKRVGVSTKRKDNFHQARYMMLNLLSLERMMKGA